MVTACHNAIIHGTFNLTCNKTEILQSDTGSIHVKSNLHIQEEQADSNTLQLH